MDDLIDDLFAPVDDLFAGIPELDHDPVLTMVMPLHAARPVANPPPPAWQARPIVNTDFSLGGCSYCGNPVVLHPAPGWSGWHHFVCSCGGCGYNQEDVLARFTPTEQVEATQRRLGKSRPRREDEY